MELLQLKYFKTVAEHGKIADAAKALFLSAPALSTSISRLEGELGVRLFDRVNNRIVLNRQGQLFLRYVNQIFFDLEGAKQALQQSVKQEGPHVSVASLASTQWVDMITAFSQEHPRFTLQCTSLRRSDLTNGGLSPQYSFLLAPEDDIPPFCAEAMDSEFLFYEHPVVMLPPEHRLARQDSVDLNQLRGETIFLPMQDFSFYDHLTRLLQKCGIPVPAGNGYSHLTTQQMVAKGLGVAFATDHVARTPGRALLYLPIRNPCQPWASRLYWRWDRVLTEDEVVFREFVKTYYHSV